MSRSVLFVAAGVLIVISVSAMGALFIVSDTEQALVLQFGKPIRVITDPGLRIKQPFIQNVIVYDKRLLDFEPPPEEVIASDHKRLIVDTYARYRIIDPLLFYQTVASETTRVQGRCHRTVGACVAQDTADIVYQSAVELSRSRHT
jgi:modulator of FtsH protease HflC